MNRHDIIEPDYKDRSAILERQSKDALATEIQQRHDALTRKRDDITGAIQSHCEEAIGIARLVETAHAHMGGRRFGEWWQAQNLPVGWAERYMRLAHTSTRSPFEKSQLRLVGIMPEPEAAAPQQRHAHAGLAWVALVGKLTATFTPEAIAAMDPIDRQIALAKLKPIVEALEAR